MSILLACTCTLWEVVACVSVHDISGIYAEARDTRAQVPRDGSGQDARPHDFLPTRFDLQIKVLLGSGRHLRTIRSGSVFAANVTHDLYRHLWRDVDRYKDINTNVGGVRWAMVAAESSVLRMFSEAGRTVGIIQRGEYSHLGKRFNWFAGRLEDGPRREERKNGVQRFALVGLLLGVLYQTGWVLF